MSDDVHDACPSRTKRGLSVFDKVQLLKAGAPNEHVVVPELYGPRLCAIHVVGIARCDSIEARFRAFDTVRFL